MQAINIQFGWDGNSRDGYRIGCRIKADNNIIDTFWFPESWLDKPDLVQYIQKKCRVTIGNEIIEAALKTIY